MFNLVGTGWEAVTDIVIVGIIARYLSLPRFGDYAFVMSFVAAFQVLCGVSMPVIIMREIAVQREKAAQFLTASLFIQGAMSLLTLLLVSVIIRFIHDDPRVILATHLAMLAIVADFLGLLFVSVARGYERMEYATYRVIVNQTLFLALLYVLVETGEQNFIRIFIALLIARLAGLLYAGLSVMKKFVVPERAVQLKLCKYMFLEAYPIALRRFIRRVGFRIDTILLNFLRSNIEAGLFHGAYKIMQGLMFVGEGLVVAVFPVLSRHYVHAKKSMDELYERSFRLLSVAGIFLGIIFFSFSQDMITLVLGKKYLPAESVLKILSGLVVLMFLTKLAERMLIVGKKQLVSTLITTLAVAINVIFDLILIPVMGVVGAAVATLLAEIALFALGLYYTYRYVSEVPAHVVIFKVLLIYSIACGSITVGDAYLGRLAGFCCGLLVFVVGLALFRLIPVAEIRQFKTEALRAMGLKLKTS